MNRALVLLGFLSALGVAAPVVAQEFYSDFALVVQVPSYETFLKNLGASPLTVDGYFITSQSGSLSPSGWASLDAANGPAIVSALGPGADQFDLLGAVSPSLLGELNLLASATWQPGQSWSIGFPFDSNDPDFVLDPDFRFSSAGGLVLSGGTVVPDDGYALAVILVVPELAGDFDVDGDVDGRDFLAWQKGESPNPLSVDDLSTWQSNYGIDPDSLAASTIRAPEPGSAILTVVTAVGILVLRAEGCITRRWLCVSTAHR